jgi:pyruvate kinase
LIGMTQTGYTAFMLSSYRPKSLLYIFRRIRRKAFPGIWNSSGMFAFISPGDESLELLPQEVR